MATNKKDKKTTQCPFCKEDILEGAKKCKHCGERLDDPTARKIQGCGKSLTGLGCLLTLLITIPLLLLLIF